jgi:hypothetical protein
MIKRGGNVEDNKIELKRKWWNLKIEKGKNEFLKDTTAFANSIGDVFYIIIGIDDKTGEIFNSPLMYDQNYIKGLIVKHVQEPFEFEIYQKIIQGKTISIIEIPISHNKPHIIKRYKTETEKEIEMYIPFRKNTSILPANKFDIDQMYLDRNKRLAFDYNMDIIISNPVLALFGDNLKNYYDIILHQYSFLDKLILVPGSIVNKGININCIRKVNLIINNKDSTEKLLIDKVMNNDVIYFSNSSDFVKIKSNDLEQIYFIYDDYVALINSDQNSFEFEIEDVIGRNYISNKFSIIKKVSGNNSCPFAF